MSHRRQTLHEKCPHCKGNLVTHECPGGEWGVYCEGNRCKKFDYLTLRSKENLLKEYSLLPFHPVSVEIRTYLEGKNLDYDEVDAADTYIFYFPDTPMDVWINMTRPEKSELDFSYCEDVYYCVANPTLEKIKFLFELYGQAVPEQTIDMDGLQELKSAIRIIKKQIVLIDNIKRGHKKNKDG